MFTKNFRLASLVSLASLVLFCGRGVHATDVTSFGSYNSGASISGVYNNAHFSWYSRLSMTAVSDQAGIQLHNDYTFHAGLYNGSDTSGYSSYSPSNATGLAEGHAASYGTASGGYNSAAVLYVTNSNDNNNTNSSSPLNEVLDTEEYLDLSNLMRYSGGSNGASVGFYATVSATASYAWYFTYGGNTYSNTGNWSTASDSGLAIFSHVFVMRAESETPS